MTASRDGNQLIRAYLADGPTELPSRSYEAVDEVVERTRQRAIRPWRNPRMSNLVRLGVGLAAIFVAAVIGFNFFRYAGTGPGGPGPATPSASPSAVRSPSPRPSPVAYEWPGPIAAGSYTTSLSWDPGLLFTFTVPDGWEGRDINVLKNGSMTVKFFPVSNVVTDTCKRTLPKTPASSPGAAANALAKLVTLSAGPRLTTIGDRGATYVEYTAKASAGCSADQYTLFQIPDQVCGAGCGAIFGSPWLGLEFPPGPEHNRLWLMNVGRGAVAVDAAWTDAATAADLVELQSVIDSVRLDTPLATPAPQPQPVDSQPAP